MAAGWGGIGGAPTPRSPLPHHASAWQINTVQLGFFLFLIDIFESVPA